jgi:arylsulfatase A-like enzyme
VHQVVDDHYANPWDRMNFNGPEPYAAEMNLVDWLADAADDPRPFICHFGMGAVHTGRGYVAARRFVDQVPADTVRLPPRETPAHPALVNHGIAKHCPTGKDDDYVRACRRNYCANVAEVDEMVGEILDTCHRHGLLDNTWVFFISDHGDMQMEHGCLWGKGNLYDAAARVPLIVRPPGGQAGATVDRPVSLIDLLPTFCDIAGVPVPETVRGHSLVPDLATGDSRHPGTALVEYHNAYLPGSCFALRRDNWKYAVYEIDGRLQPQLFNIAEDPDEIDDRIQAEPDTAAGLDAELRAQLDVDAVVAANTDWDRRMFTAWRASLSRAEYLRLLREEVYGCHGEEFTNAHLAKLEAWIARGP